MGKWVLLIVVGCFFANCGRNVKQQVSIDYVIECKECAIETIRSDAGDVEWEISRVGEIKHGRTRGWWPNNKLASEKYYKNGKIHGPVRQWDESGTLIIDSYWRDDHCVENCSKNNE